MTTRRRRVPSESQPLSLVASSEDFSADYFYNSNFHDKDDRSVLVNKALSDDENIKMPRDRTAEFGSAVRSLQGRQIGRVVSVRDVKKVKMLQSYGEFMMVAKSIGKNIANTYTKLEKLTLRKLKVKYLSKRNSNLTFLLFI